MDLPNDIASCHRIIRELVSVIDGFRPQLEGYVQQIETQRNQTHLPHPNYQKTDNSADMSTLVDGNTGIHE